MSETTKTKKRSGVPSISVTYGHTGASASSNLMGMRPMQERAFQRRGE